MRGARAASAGVVQTGVRTILIAVVVVVVFVTQAVAQSAVAIDPARPISRIGFGSCAKQGDPQPIWTGVAAAEPELFLLIGDNIYGDTRDMRVMREKYAQFAADPGFAALRRRVPLLGTWDDHDFGENNAGADYPMKRPSQQLLLDFFGVPANSPRRQQEGVYHAQTFGPPGRRVQVILLDTRYFRSPLKTNADGRIIPNDDADTTILGQAQWRWLGEQLRQPAELRLVVSSIQVVAEGHGGEKWMNFPRERRRLYELIRDTRAAGVVFLSGDRHFADLSVMEWPGLGYPLFDLTSSGLTQAARKWRPLSPNTNRVAGMSFDTNFGLIAIDWQRDDPIVSLQIRDEAGDVRLNQKLPLSLLRPAAPTTSTTSTTTTRNATK